MSSLWGVTTRQHAACGFLLHAVSASVLYSQNADNSSYTKFSEKKVGGRKRLENKYGFKTEEREGIVILLPSTECSIKHCGLQPGL